jgi:hypothetical protein
VTLTASAVSANNVATLTAPAFSDEDFCGNGYHWPWWWPHPHPHPDPDPDPWFDDSFEFDDSFKFDTSIDPKVVQIEDVTEIASIKQNIG